jgi:hypothetical protein
MAKGGEERKGSGISDNHRLAPELAPGAGLKNQLITKSRKDENTKK